MYFVWAIEHGPNGRYLRRDFRSNHRTKAVNRCMKKGGYVEEYPSRRVIYQNIIPGLDLGRTA